MYIAFAVLGEVLLLIGFALLAAGEPTGSLQIRDVMAAVPGSPWRSPRHCPDLCGLRCSRWGLILVHTWMPGQPTRQPRILAAAVLSGAAVKAGIGSGTFSTLRRSVCERHSVTLDCSAFHGVAVGLTQSNPRTVLAYSSVSRWESTRPLRDGLGCSGRPRRSPRCVFWRGEPYPGWQLFLAIGMMATARKESGRTTIIVAAVLALGLGALP